MWNGFTFAANRNVGQGARDIWRFAKSIEHTGDRQFKVGNRGRSGNWLVAADDYRGRVGFFDRRRFHADTLVAT